MGIDEAGRGPLAGPVVAAGVILPRGDPPIEGVDDSKKLSPKKRETLYTQIVAAALGYFIAEVDNQTIDQINIYQATKRAVYACVEGIAPRPDFIYVDGDMKFDFGIPYRSVVAGDSLVYHCACASILAKVHRDRLMSTLPERYALYRFDRHKGYATELHYELLHRYGLSDLHRKTFCLDRG